MADVHVLIEALRQFRDERDWSRFHNPKDLALALSIEAAELNELFLWKAPDEANRARVAEELADVLIYALLLVDKYGFDVDEIIGRKLEINGRNYPVSTARRNAEKHH